MTETRNRLFRVTAHNTAADHENKIHDDAVAQAYGFRGGLVPGTTVYGYMIPAVLDRFGPAWLERGSMHLWLLSPCYEGEIVVASCDDAAAKAERQDGSGSLYAAGAVLLHPVAEAPPAFALHSLPGIDRLGSNNDERPVASSQSIVPGNPLGSIRQIVDVDRESGVPECLLRMANDILTKNFKLSPWIHAGSEIRHHDLASPGQEVTVSGMIWERFERKGRNFAVAALTMSTDHEGSLRTLASVRHTFLYALEKR